MTSAHMLMLKHETKQVLEKGYIKQDYKNLLMWGSLSSIILLTGLIAFIAGIQHGYVMAGQTINLSDAIADNHINSNVKVNTPLTFGTESFLKHHK